MKSLHSLVMMKIEMKEFLNTKGEVILYTGKPNLNELNELSLGVGDVWHSSLDQGFANVFQDIVYQTATFFLYINDFQELEKCISWRINPDAFAVRKTVWDSFGGFDKDFSTNVAAALHFGYNLVRVSGGIALYVKGLYEKVETTEKIKVSDLDRYIFYRKNYQLEHILLMVYRKGIYKYVEWSSFIKSRKIKPFQNKIKIDVRQLNILDGNPTISYIIPTMGRQEFTIQLLNDLRNQTYLPQKVIIIDATPIEKRDEALYNFKDYPFEIILNWQKTKGSCRARNEAILYCDTDYIIFGDDDIRIPPDFVENHIRFLQTYKVQGCSGVDIKAHHEKEDLDDLKNKLNWLNGSYFKSGASLFLSNSNCCFETKMVHKIIGNDINFDGGYGEDFDFGMRMIKNGVLLFHNPYSINLHLKPKNGGYKEWIKQSKILGKKRKKQPWELDKPVRFIVPEPSPTMMYLYLKHFTFEQVVEYKYKYMFKYIFKKNFFLIPARLIYLPIKLIKFNKSLFYAKRLIKLGERYN